MIQICCRLFMIPENRPIDPSATFYPTASCSPVSHQGILCWICYITQTQWLVQSSVYGLSGSFLRTRELMEKTYRNLILSLLALSLPLSFPFTPPSLVDVVAAAPATSLQASESVSSLTTLSLTSSRSLFTTIFRFSYSHHVLVRRMGSATH